MHSFVSRFVSVYKEGQYQHFQGVPYKPNRVCSRSYLPPVVVGLVDEEEDLVLLHEDPLAVLGDVLEVEGHVDEDLLRVQRPVLRVMVAMVVGMGVEVAVEVVPAPVMVVEVEGWKWKYIL